MAKLPTVQRLARQVAETAIYEVEYKGKTISEWCELFCKGDLVEVIRCSDCRFRGSEDCAMFYRCDCGEQYSWETDNDYCSYGKRKDSD